MSLLTARYLDPNDVSAYLLNKIDEGTNVALQQITPAVLSSWIANGEVKVEKDLYPFYAIPFETTTGGAWTTLPAPVYNMLWTLLMDSACIYILEFQFGRITNTTGQDFIAYLRAEYKDYLNSFYMKTDNGTYILGQATNLALNPQASNANGLVPPAMAVTNMYSRQMAYAARQINNPAKTWYNARIYGTLECQERRWWCTQLNNWVCY